MYAIAYYRFSATSFALTATIQVLFHEMIERERERMKETSITFSPSTVKLIFSR